MKRKLLIILFLSFIAFAQVFAQSHTVTGTVTANDDGLPIPGATVKIKGTATGTQTNTAGKFTLSVPAGATLVFSFIGYEPLELSAGGGVVNAKLKVSSQLLGEVVVTSALGIKKANREVGYATTLVSGSNANAATPVNPINGLTGKVAGLVIQQTDDGIDPSIRINLRGNRSLLGYNQALVVLDGSPVPTAILETLNPDDIESYNVLNGSGAAALYGSQASNGAIVVTTKRGTANARPVITYDNSFTLNQVANFPKIQNGYGQYGGEANPFVNPLTLLPEDVPFENQNYGPPFNGSTVNVGVPINSPTGQQLTTKYSAQSDPPIKAFFNTGINEQNSISFRQGDAANSFGFSARDVDVTGTMPLDTKHVDNVRVTGAKTYGIFKVDFTANYTGTTINKAGSPSNVYSQLLQFPADINIKQFQDVNNPLSPANESNYFSNYSLNPYWYIYNQRDQISENQFQGNLNLSLTPTKWLDISYRVDDNFGVYRAKNTSAGIQWSAYALSQPESKYGANNEAYYNPVVKPQVADIVAYGDGSSALVNTFGTNPVYDGDQGLARLEGTALLNFHHTFFNAFKSSLLLGNSIWNEGGEYTYDQSSNLLVPGYYNLNTITGTPTVYNDEEVVRQVAFFGDAAITYKGFATLEGTLRNDRDSRLSAQNQSFYYPSVKAVFIPTEAIPGLKNNEILDYWKIYGDLSRVGNISIPPYSIQNTYNVSSGFPYGSTGALNLNTAEYAPGLKPEIISEQEVGTEIGLLKDRLHLTADYYYQKSRNQTLNVSVSTSTGYTSQLLNAGEIDSYGEELGAQAIMFTKGLNSVGWTVGGNVAFNESKVISLLPGVDKLELSNLAGVNGYSAGGIYAVVGQSYPQLYATDYARDPQGQVIVNPSPGPGQGTPENNPNLVDEGRTSPKINLGLNTSVSYKFVTLNVIADYRAGDVLYNGIGSSMDFAGSSAVSASAGRSIFIYPNSVINTGTGAAAVYTPNTSIPVFKGGWEYWSTYPVNVGSPYITSGAFWEIREVSLAFNLSQFVTNSKFIKGLTFSLVGRNLFLFLPKSEQWGDPQLDATGAIGNAVGSNGTGQVPSNRVYGGNLQVTF